MIFHDKSKIEIEENYLYVIKALYEKPTNILKDERLKSSPLNQEQGKDACFYHFYLTKYWMLEPEQPCKKKKYKVPNLERKRKNYLSLKINLS